MAEKRVSKMTRWKRRTNATSMLQNLTDGTTIPGMEEVVSPHGIPLRQSKLYWDEAERMLERIRDIIGMDEDEFYRRWSDAWVAYRKTRVKETGWDSDE